MTKVILRERDVMLNPALGARALLAFTHSYHKKQANQEDKLTLWHIFTVLPLVFHAPSRRAMCKRLERSGLRSILNRDPDNDIAQNEAIFNLQHRMVSMADRTFRALNLALCAGLITLTDGELRPTVAFEMPKDAPHETKEILKAADKLGAWAGPMGIFEFLTVLGVDPIQ